MAHRGRLNVLAHVLGRPYETILREFEGERTLEAVARRPRGRHRRRQVPPRRRGHAQTTPAGEITRHARAPNPSHLEAVDPVVEGRTRAEQTDRSTRAGYARPVGRAGRPDPRRRRVPRRRASSPRRSTSQTCDGYSTGGTLHLIANNQIGFTTDPADGALDPLLERPRQGLRPPDHPRQRRRPRGVALPAVRLAMAFRRRFGTDVVIDLVGYRRHGHNEQDEPAYTQPLMAAADRAAADACASSTRSALLEEGVVTQEDADAIAAARRHDAEGGARAPEDDLRPGRARGRARGPHPGRRPAPRS